tara:strand:+ start:2382 stop:2813 length:432 start_codon:yes stop_codon:yes gene_type:complete
MDYLQRKDELNIRHFKLANGEEIIGILAVKNDDSYIIEGPVMLIPNVLGGMQFQHWFPLSNTKNFKVYKVNVMQSARVEKYVVEQYIKFVMQEPRSQLKIGGIKEAITEMLEKEKALLEEMSSEYEESLPSGLLDIPKKETIH